MIKNFLKDKERIVIIIITAVCFQIFYLWGVRALADEVVHFAQINKISQGSYQLNPYITTLPFFHYFFASLLEVFRALHIDAFLAFLKLVRSEAEFGLLVTRAIIGGIFAFALIRIMKRPEEDITENKPEETDPGLSAGILILLSPIIFPMFTLVYTDTIALALILASVITGLHKRSFLSALSILCAVLVRQPSIIWILLPMIFITEYEIKALFQEVQKPFGQRTLQNLSFLAAKTVGALKYHLSVIAVFVLYIIINKGVAFGDKGHHVIGLNLSNIWFFGFIFFICCIGYRYHEIKASCKRVFASLYEMFVQKSETDSTSKSWMRIALPTVVLVLLAVLFWDTYAIQHTYNTSRYLGFLRNKILAFTTTSILAKSLFGLISFTGLYAFLAYPIIQKSRITDFVLKICSTLPIAFMPLIEQRYYIPAIGLFLLFISSEYRQRGLTTENNESEGEAGPSKGIWPLSAMETQTVCNFIIAMYLFISIAHRTFFL